MAASEKLIEEFCETIHKEPSSKAWSMWQHHILPKKFILKALSPLPCWQQHSLLLTVLESIHKFIIELHVLQYLFVRESNKKQRTGRNISNFSSLIITKCSWGLQCGFPPCTLQVGQEECITGHAIESRAYWLILQIATMFPILTGRNRVLKTFIMVNVTLTCKR